jgi:hypothetical protein
MVTVITSSRGTDTAYPSDLDGRDEEKEEEEEEPEDELSDSDSEEEVELSDSEEEELCDEEVELCEDEEQDSDSELSEDEEQDSDSDEEEEEEESDFDEEVEHSVVVQRGAAWTCRHINDAVTDASCPIGTRTSASGVCVRSESQRFHSEMYTMLSHTARTGRRRPKLVATPLVIAKRVNRRQVVGIH